MDAKELGQQPVTAHVAQLPKSYEVQQHTGLTKRELFAAMAMQGLCADTGTAGMKLETLTEQAVELADYLLAELAKEQP